MKRNLALTIPTALFLGLYGCMSPDAPTPSQTPSTQNSGDPQPGQLELISQGSGSGLAKISARASDSSSVYEFDLDTAKSSVQRFFLLENTGD